MDTIPRGLETSETGCISWRLVGFPAFRASRPALAPPWRERERERERRRARRGGGASGPAGRLDVHPRVAMQILRHSKIAVPMEIYTVIPSAATRAAFKRVGDELSQALATPPIRAASTGPTRT